MDFLLLSGTQFEGAMSNSGVRAIAANQRPTRAVSDVGAVPDP
jgi:hypothetical protein